MIRWGALITAVICAGCSKPTPPAAPAPSAEATRLSRITASEAIVEALNLELRTLDKSIADLTFPGARGRSMFAARVAVRDLGAKKDAPRERIADARIALSEWPTATVTAKAVPRARLALWKPLLSGVRFFAHAHFYVIRGEPTQNGRYAADVGFYGLAHRKNGAPFHIAAKIATRWQRCGAASKKWCIDVWKTKRVSLAERDGGVLFREVLADVLRADPDALRRARRAPFHDHIWIELSRLARKVGDARNMAVAQVFTSTQGRNRTAALGGASVQVVDLDSDGLDDIYVTGLRKWPAFFRNLGDGRFAERTKQVGLSIIGASSAIFGDFDNDGDPDAFVGTGWGAARYLVNEGGTLVDRTTERIAGGTLPTFAFSMSTADYNNDGLLDVYLSTSAGYAVVYDLEIMRQGLGARPLPREGKLLRTFLPPKQAKKMYTRALASHAYKDRAGPPNVLLKNLGGGRFARAPKSENLEIWRNSWQGTWADIDDDGDVDLYVANDFAPDNFFRNNGDGTFTDSTKADGLLDLNFGMGATFGDYDGDGRQDLYVSNMFSKAGRRILDQAGDVGARFKAMATGNRLLRNTKRGFVRVSGHGDSPFPVEAAGWAWGGQFVDIDGDGHLDLYAASGFLSVPSEVTSMTDT